MIHIEMSQEEFDNLTKDAARYRFLREGQDNMAVFMWEEGLGDYPIASDDMDSVVDRQMEDKDAVE